MSSHAQARLRKTFRYPTDDDSSDSPPEALDEEEQETLIATLRARDQATNTLYTRLFTSFPLLLTLAYFPPLSHHFHAALPILAVSSLLASALGMYILPPGRTGVAMLDRVVGSGSTGTSGRGRERRTVGGGAGGGGGIAGMDEGQGPLGRWLMPMNACLAGLILIAGLLGRGAQGGQGGAEEGMRLWILPAFALGAVMAVKVTMGGVDVDELEELRYDYKGA